MSITKCDKFLTVKNQFLAVICANFITLAYGGGLGWISPFLPVYLSDNSPLITGSITLDEASWIGAYFCIGGIIGNCLYGFLSNTFGKKMGVMLLGFPNMIAWFLIIFATNVYYLYIAQVLTGISGGGILVSISLYVAEISEPNIRGELGSIATISNNLGILLTFIMAIYLGPITVSKIIVIIPIIFIFIMIFIPETPQHLLKCNKIEKAEKSLKFYRRGKIDDAFKKEFEILKINAGNIDMNRINIKELFTKPAIKGLTISILLIILNPLSGTFPIMIYTASVFAESGSEWSPDESSVAVAAIRLIGTYISLILIDRYGRKILLINGLLGNIVGLAAMGLFTYLYKNQIDVSSFQFVPVISICFAILSTSVGVVPVGIVIITEVLPKRVRSIGTVICIVTFNIVSFGVLKIFPLILIQIHLYGCMLTFIVFSILGVIFVIFGVPETKGKNLECPTEISEDVTKI